MRLMPVRRAYLPRPESQFITFGASFVTAQPSRALKSLIGATFVTLILAGTIALVVTSRSVALPVHAAAAKPAASAVASQAQPTSLTATASSGANTTTITPTCHPGSYSLPSVMSTAGRNSGVYTQVDPAASYAVYGGSSSEIMDQIAACTPVRSGGNEFAANTGYSLSNYYTYAEGSDGLCRVNSAVVTLHINQVFPAWQGSGVMTSTWNTFITNLHTHEQGHVDLDKTYAQKVYTAMTNAPAASCDSLKASVDGNVKSVTDALMAANDNYDATTKHGTTQGAVL